MAKNVVIVDNQIIKLDKKPLAKRLSRKIKKIIRYNKIKEIFLRKKHDMALTIHIEFTSCCNLKCKMCPNNIDTPTRGRGFMELTLFREKIVDYIGKNPQFELMNLWQGGEILLHPKLKDMLSILGEAKKKYDKFPKVSLLTNAACLDRDRSKIIIESQAVDEICFSIDYGNKKDFEDTRTGAVWEKILENVNNFIEMKQKNSSRIVTRILSITSLDELGIFSSEFLDLVREVDYFHPRPAHSWDGSTNLNFGRYKEDFAPKTRECGWITNTLAVLWNGLVVPCCQDILGRGVIGDLNRQTLLEVFNSSTRKEYIQLMRQGKRQMIELCKNCAR